MTLKIVIEYDDDAISIEELNAMIENLKRNLHPTPNDVYFELRKDMDMS